MTTLAIHGGAGALPRSDMTPERATQIHAALRDALRAGHALLRAGQPSIDAVEGAVTWLEDCPLFNAGRGSSFTRDGTVEMEAAIMDGGTGQAGSTCLLRRVRNPIQLARQILLHTPHIAIGGEAAEQFAVSRGLPLEAPEYFFTQFRWDAMVKLRGTQHTALSEDIVVPAAAGPEAMSTVGAVACDARGNLAAAGSSGGTSNKYSGRIGQAGVIGSGVFARNATCAVSCTGQGEAFMRCAAAHEVSALIEYRGLPLPVAAEVAIRERLPGKGGLIAVDRQGNVALPYNTAGMYRGWIDAAGVLRTAIYQEVQEWPVG